jgi:hypothetical protein
MGQGHAHADNSRRVPEQHRKVRTLLGRTREQTGYKGPVLTKKRAHDHPDPAIAQITIVIAQNEHRSVQWTRSSAARQISPRLAKSFTAMTDSHIRYDTHKEKVCGISCGLQAPESWYCCTQVHFGPVKTQASDTTFHAVHKPRQSQTYSIAHIYYIVTVSLFLMQAVPRCWCAVGSDGTSSSAVQPQLQQTLQGHHVRRRGQMCLEYTGLGWQCWSFCKLRLCVSHRHLLLWYSTAPQLV